LSSTLLATGVGTIGAYALARLRFLGRGFLASATLITYLVPPSILFIPLYAQMRNLGLANSLAGLIAAYPSFTVPFVTWLLMGYFESIPEELEEAAMIDGATRFGAFLRVVLPLSAPGVLAAGLYAFTQAWNEFLYALVFITDGRLRTLPVGPAAVGIPSTTSPAFDAAGALYTTPSGRRYRDGEIEDLWPLSRFPLGGARLGGDLARYAYGPPLLNLQLGAARGQEMLVTTFDRDRGLGVLYRIVDGRAELLAGGTPPAAAPPVFKQTEAAAVGAA